MVVVNKTRRLTILITLKENLLPINYFFFQRFLATVRIHIESRKRILIFHYKRKK